LLYRITHRQARTPALIRPRRAGSTGPVRILLQLLAGIAVAITAAWGAGAIYYAPIASERVRGALAAAFVVSTLVAFVVTRCSRRTLALYALVFSALVIAWFQIPASNDRNWQPEVAVTPYATTEGDTVTIHGVRNFNYRTETDFDARWETRAYRLSDLDSADLIAVYWAGKPIAHIMLSFGFRNKDHLAVSIETRKEKGESYSTLAGFFRQYELYYVFGDERDLLRVRTTFRQPQEDVYVYRLRVPPENIRRVFLDYLRTINALRERPRFYNTLTTNCTTAILVHSRVNPHSPPLSWKILLSGYVPDYLYELGKLDTTMSFADLERVSRINDRAHAADQDPEFSARIRKGLPVPGS